MDRRIAAVLLLIPLSLGLYLIGSKGRSGRRLSGPGWAERFSLPWAPQRPAPAGASYAAPGASAPSLPPPEPVLTDARARAHQSPGASLGGPPSYDDYLKDKTAASSRAPAPSTSFSGGSSFGGFGSGSPGSAPSLGPTGAPGARRASAEDFLRASGPGRPSLSGAAPSFGGGSPASPKKDELAKGAQPPAPLTAGTSLGSPRAGELAKDDSLPKLDRGAVAKNDASAGSGSDGGLGGGGGGGGAGGGGGGMGGFGGGSGINAKPSGSAGPPEPGGGKSGPSSSPAGADKDKENEKKDDDSPGPGFISRDADHIAQAPFRAQEGMPVAPAGLQTEQRGGEFTNAADGTTRVRVDSLHLPGASATPRAQRFTAGARVRRVHAALDPDKIPFIVLPTDFVEQQRNVKERDFVMVSHRGRTAFGIVGEFGQRGKIGEMSTSLARALGIDPERGARADVQYHVFPLSADRQMRPDAQDIQRRGQTIAQDRGFALRAPPAAPVATR